MISRYNTRTEFNRMKMQAHISEVSELNERWLPTISEEIGTDNPARYLAKGTNFQVNCYYHNSDSGESKVAILKNGFDFKKAKIQNDLGQGMYCGRDRNAILGFYTADLHNPNDFIINVTGNFNFINLIRWDDLQNFRQKFSSTDVMKFWLCKNRYDGIRYYDPYCTGEEFVLCNLSAVSFS